MSRPIIPREQAAQNLAVPTRVLVRYEARGLVRAVNVAGVEGYEPAEIRRLWTIVSCQRDLGINLAGVEAVLKLRDELAGVHRRLGTLARELEAALEELPRPDSDA
ncbi:MAG: chaperone modulator CbpM [Isosphaeraceae bacterium]|nr:chaperone modulator CbpM [Isosphaeraceae bacterium]